MRIFHLCFKDQGHRVGLAGRCARYWNVNIIAVQSEPRQHTISYGHSRNVQERP